MKIDVDNLTLEMMKSTESGKIPISFVSSSPGVSDVSVVTRLKAQTREAPTVRNKSVVKCDEQ
jgi:hypothetical protein